MSLVNIKILLRTTAIQHIKTTILCAIILTSCRSSVSFKEKQFLKELNSYVENFENEIDFERYWSNKSQNTNNKRYNLENKHIKLTTAKGSEERVKIRFNKTNLTFGTYEWKVYVPKMRMYENCSIGAFLYRDDGHELDFEIGSGNSEKRKMYSAKKNELLLYCSSQQNPHSTKIVKIQEETWYNLKLELSIGARNNYLAKWYLEGEKIHEVQLDYGKRFKFKAFCSLENIHFIGDKPTSKENYTYFDFFKYNSAEERTFWLYDNLGV